MLGFYLYSLACVSVFRALVTSPTPHSSACSQDGDCVRDVGSRGHLADAHPSAHEPGGLCSLQNGNKIQSGKGLSLFTDQQAESQDGLAVPGMIYFKTCRVTS